MDRTLDKAKAVKLLDELLPLVTDEKPKESYENRAKALKEANRLIKDSTEKESLYNFYLVRTIFDVASYLFVHNTFPEEKRVELDTIPLPETVAATAKEFQDKAKTVEDDITNQMEAYRNSRDEMGVFEAVLQGATPEEAEKRLAAYKQAQAQALNR